MIKLVLFDLGSTLIYAKEAWESSCFWHWGDNALVDVLQKSGVQVNGDVFSGKKRTFLDQYYSQLDQGSTREPSAIVILEEILAKKGFVGINPAVLRKGLKALYEIVNENWEIEQDSLPTLEILKQNGYRLGLVSNTSDDAHVQALIDTHGLRAYFEFVITSAVLGFRKPDPRIFQAALDYFRISASEAAMVGDTLDADIQGANHLGIYSIWIKRRAIRFDQDSHPQASVESLREIPAILKLLG